MDDVDSIREWLKHVPDRLLVAESGLRDNNVARIRCGSRLKGNVNVPRARRKLVRMICADILLPAERK